MRSRQRSRLEKAASFFLGVLLPLVCFAVNEIVDPFGLGRAHQLGGRSARGLATWFSYLYSPCVQRVLYAFVLWAMASLTAELFGPKERFRPWVRMGLKAGVWTAGAFSFWYAAVVPLALLSIPAYGLGLLGLAPFATLLTYVFARRANSAAARYGSVACRGRGKQRERA